MKRDLNPPPKKKKKKYSMALGGTTLLLLSLAYVCVNNGDGYTFDNVESLTTALFSSYNKFLRPFEDDSNPTIIYMGIWLASIVVSNILSPGIWFRMRMMKMIMMMIIIIMMKIITI